MRQTIQANSPPDVLFDNIVTRDPLLVPSVDLYLAGFPCQPWSHGEKRQGFADKEGRGTIFWEVFSYIERRKPAAWLLENVFGLVTMESGKYYRKIMAALRISQWHAVVVAEFGTQHACCTCMLARGFVGWFIGLLKLTYTLQAATRVCRHRARGTLCVDYMHAYLVYVGVQGDCSHIACHVVCDNKCNAHPRLVLYVCTACINPC